MNTCPPPTPPACRPFLEPEIERELLRAYIDSAHDGIFVVCDEMKFHVANPLLAEWLGVCEAELIAHGRRVPITELFSLAETEALFRHHFGATLQGQATRFEAEIRPPRGEPRWVEISMNRVHLDVGELVIGILRDLTKHRTLQTTLQYHACHDDLTGLTNRREFLRRLHALVDSRHVNRGPHALVYLDLDQFKVVNDTCGHLAGDELLRQLGGRLKRLVSRRDTIARLGGDEFGILLHNCSIETATLLAESLCEAVAGYRFAWDGCTCNFEVTASVGVCAINGDTLSAEDVLSSADAACYVAKESGRNRVQPYFSCTTCMGKRQEMEWVSRLQRALEENRFQVWQQHILGLKGGTDTDGGHTEMLLRLVDKDGAIITPDHFIPAAERYGLMPAIDRWIIQHLLLDGPSSGHHAGMARRIAINLSGASLNDDRFLSFVEDVLGRTRIAGDSLCFEITETVAVANFCRVHEVMQRLKQFGCRFALDDFGSGMSSFSYLKNLPVDYLKIDGALVRHIADDDADFAMVEAINRIGSVLGLKTIAEFVETEATLEKLRKIGVDYAQGYAIHRPEPFPTR